MAICPFLTGRGLRPTPRSVESWKVLRAPAFYTAGSFRFLTTGCLPFIERHEVASLVAAYDRSGRPSDGTYAKSEWLAVSGEVPSFKYHHSEGDVHIAFLFIDSPEACARALLNFAEHFRTNVFYATLTLVKQGSASTSGGHTLGIIVSFQSVEVRDTHGRPAVQRGITSMTMPRTASLQDDLLAVAGWLFAVHFE